MTMHLKFNNRSNMAVDSGLFGDLLKRGLKVIEKEISGYQLTGEEMIELIVVDDDEMRELNKNYRGYDESTDVLSFGYLEGERGKDDLMVGQIIISAEKALKQADERGVSCEDEMRFLFVHGFLHVCGIHHDTPEDEARMFQLMDTIMGEKLPPYRSAEND